MHCFKSPTHTVNQLGRVLYAAFVDAHPHLASLLVVPPSAAAATAPALVSSTAIGDDDDDDDASALSSLSPAQRRRRAKKQRQQQQKQQQQQPSAASAQSVPSCSLSALPSSASAPHPPLLESILHVIEYYAACIGELAEMARVVIATISNQNAAAALSESASELALLSDSASAAEAAVEDPSWSSSQARADIDQSILNASHSAENSALVDESVFGSAAAEHNQSITSESTNARTVHANLFSPLPATTPFSSPVGVTLAAGRPAAAATAAALNDNDVDLHVDDDDDDDGAAVEQSEIIGTSSADNDDSVLLSSTLDKRSNRDPQQWRPCVFELRKNRIEYHNIKAGNAALSVSGMLGAF